MSTRALECGLCGMDHPSAEPCQGSTATGLAALHGLPTSGVDDATALDVLAALLRANTWSPAADFLEAIAGIVQATGRTII